MKASSPDKPQQPIAVGDLVVVARASACCGSTAWMGHTFKVTRIGRSPTSCHKCDGRVGAPAALGSPTGKWAGLDRLKRIPPLEELEGQRTEEKLHEPA